MQNWRQRRTILPEEIQRSAEYHMLPTKLFMWTVQPLRLQMTHVLSRLWRKASAAERAIRNSSEQLLNISPHTTCASTTKAHACCQFEANALHSSCMTGLMARGVAMND
eukprot:14678629-Heterocapsa_arctica.AAC.1